MRKVADAFRRPSVLVEAPEKDNISLSTIIVINFMNDHLSKTPQFSQSYLEPFVNDPVSEMTATTF